MADRRSPGLFISFEGTEGSGKSTQMRLLVDRLRGLGHTVVENQEPGTTAIGKQIRRILLDPQNQEIAPMTELLLMFASRAQAAVEIVEPALARGDIVVSDRFTDSSLAYQGGARGLGFDAVRALHRLALGSLSPDLTLCLTIDLKTGLARAHNRNRENAIVSSEERLDRESTEFHGRVDQAYREIARRESNRFRLVDGSGGPERVAQRIWVEVEPLLAS